MPVLPTFPGLVLRARGTTPSALGRAAAASLAGALLLGACGSSDGGTQAGSDSDQPQSFEDIDYSSPISDFLGIESTDFDSDDSQAEMLAREQQIQEGIAACMIDQGFEYTPEDTSQYISFGSESDDGLPYGSREWTEKYGFGVSTQRWDQSELGPDLVGYDSGDVAEAVEYDDPNQEYRDSLSLAEQQAWEAALYGDQPEIAFEDLSQDEIDAAYDEFYADYEPTGCYEISSDAVYSGTDQGVQSQFFEEFSDELEVLYASIEEHPDILAHREEVSACVVEKGFEPIAGNQDAYEVFEFELEGIGPDYMTDPLEEAGLDPEQMSDEEIQEFYETAYAFDPADSATLAEVQKLEIDTALAVWDCGGSELNEYLIFNELVFEIEEQFLIDNAEAIAPFKAEAE